MKLNELLLSLMVGFAALNAGAQNLTVKGTVTDGASGDPVPFASIVVKGTSNWTTTDLDGKYTVTAPSNGVLSVEILGYLDQDVNIDGRTLVDIVMNPDLDQLSESVVIGYGVQKKKLITGSTVNVSSDKILATAPLDAFGALQSQAAGVNIIQKSGQPGESYKMTIRGMGTKGSNTPLYVVDGVPGASITALSPNDIESIDILKDAASSAIYGARAANGVVLVTTKKGKAGKVQVDFDAYYGWQNPNTNGVTPLGAKEYMQIIDKAYEIQGTKCLCHFGR